MGEYATRLSDGQEIKIGTCESMYYLRFEDRNKVRKLPGSLDARTCDNLFWRLPFPDEDHLQPGDYENFHRGLRLYRQVSDRVTTMADGGECHDRRYEDFDGADLEEQPGTIQLRHEPSGLLLNVTCHHGRKLPDVGPEAKAFWNGKGHSFELAHLKNTADGVLPVIRCRHCGNMWRESWADVWEYIEPQLRQRFEDYRTAELFQADPR